MSPIIHTFISTSGSLVVVSGTVVISVVLPEALFEEAISDLFFLECETADTTTPILTHRIRTSAIRAGT